MSWLFSRALVAEYSEASCTAEELFAPLSVMPTQHKFWRKDKTMEYSDLSQFGLTFVLLTATRGEELLMSFRAAFHVKTYRHQAPEPELKVHDLGFGRKWLESSVRYDPSTSSWKTHRCLWEEVLPWSSVTLPTWGMTRSGYVYQHASSARLMKEIAPGWSGETFPTPSVAMVKGSSQKALTRKNGQSRLRNRLDYWVERDGRNGRLNPEFVEWVMGWPTGWTAIEPLAMDRYLEWKLQHSPYYPASAKEAA